MDEMISTIEAGEILHLTPQRITQMLRSGELPGQRIGKLWIVDRRDVEELKDRREAAEKGRK